ncbi:hypothetical protein [Hymenobacter convexus]|uniref:hypothetical protein n=1 Tax=Hymenobacter sp. CA1UV-4 TaxID=3063782 RepID=UPI00271371B4|nr:hypothetical protein [Hymenobacter sp. CA1UV-4]MDO7854392.1 hypothetical protein [Hymenobacter sp. CA1UV-4]
MKLLLLVLLALLLKLPAGAPPAVRVTFSPLTEAAYLAAKKTAVLTKPAMTFPVKKRNGRIVIPTAKGPKIFTDVVIDEAAFKKGHGEEESTVYTYLGYLVDFKCHLIQVQYYETTQWLLIDGSGHRIELWGEPMYSPDRRHIAAICMGIEYSGGQPNILQLLELRNGVLQQVWEQEPKTWEPYRIKWLSSSTLLLSREMWTCKNPGTTFTYAKLTIQ